MPNDSGMSSKRRRLASALRALRDTAGVSTHALADQLGWSQSKVSKTETGRTRPSPAAVRAWCRATGAIDDQQVELVQLAEDVQIEARTWRNLYRTAGGAAGRQGEYRELNERATRIAIYQPAIIPGLLQTAEYARRVLALHGVPQDEIGPAAAARVERQAVLYDETKTIELLIAEHVLRWPIGPPHVIAAQLDRIQSLMTLPNLHVGIIPDDAEPAALPLSPFVYREFGDDDPLVTVETNTVELMITDPDEVTTYRDLLTKHQKTAVYGAEANPLIRTALAERANGH